MLLILNFALLVPYIVFYLSSEKNLHMSLSCKNATSPEYLYFINFIAKNKHKTKDLDTYWTWYWTRIQDIISSHNTYTMQPAYPHCGSSLSKSLKASANVEATTTRLFATWSLWFSGHPLSNFITCSTVKKTKN